MTSLPSRCQELLGEIAELAGQAGCPPPTLVAVTKTRQPEEIRAAYDAGLRDFGENRAQDFSRRLDELGDLEGVRWHFIGHLQTNKVSKVVGRTRLIHSVDSCRLLECLDNRARRTQSDPVPVLLQVNVSGESSKSGFAPSGLEGAIEFARRLEHVRIRGMMTMAPADADEAAQRRCFAELRDAHQRLLDSAGEAYQGTELSMGMSHDYRAAVQEGATLVRIGSALFHPEAR